MKNNRSRILVIDDNPKNLDVLSELFDQHDFIMLFALDGKSGLQRTESGHPDLILLDIMMPEMDGFETCRRLKASDKTKDIPVIFMTALSETADKLTGFECGAVDYITKPIQPEEVLARVNAHLTIRKLQQELQKKNMVLEKCVVRLAEQNDQLKEKNTQLDEKNVQLKALNADKDKFFSIIAHDLRNPLNTLRLLPEIIVQNIEKYSKDDILKVIRTQQNTMENLSALLENLLTWSRIRQGIIEYCPQQIDVKELIARNVTLLRPNAEQKQITLSSEIEEKTFVYADCHMVDTVVRNLLSNALKFTEPGGNITISAIQNDLAVEVSVSDTGIGIAEKHLPELFRIDTKYKRSGTANEPGTGLGLLLCKEFVKRNDGSIRVESEVGRGSTFKITLPKSSEKDAPNFIT